MHLNRSLKCILVGLVKCLEWNEFLSPDLVEFVYGLELKDFSILRFYKRKIEVVTTIDLVELLIDGPISVGQRVLNN